MLASQLAACMVFFDDLGHACTAIGCNDGANIRVAPNLSSLNVRLRVCLNEVCDDIQLDANGTPTYLTNTLGAYVYFADGLDVRIDAATVLANGDEYTLEIFDAQNVQLASYRWIATYVVSQPNGPDCDPICTQATLDEANAE